MMLAHEIKQFLWDRFQEMDEADWSSVRDTAHAIRDVGRVESVYANERHISASSIKMALPQSEGGCLRKLELKRDHAPKQTPHPGQILMRENGNAGHAMIQAIFSIQKPGGVRSVDHEFLLELRPENGLLPVVAYVDTILDQNMGDPTIIDIKTVRGNAFRYLKGLRESDALQVSLYMHWYSVLSGNDANGVVIYLDREGQNFCQVYDVPPLDVNRLSINTTLARRAEDVLTGHGVDWPRAKLVEKRGKKEVPWVCTYCDYYGGACTGPKE